MKPIITFSFLFFTIFSFCQTSDTIPRKQIDIPRITVVPTIDGILDDQVWANAPIATNFVERQPNNGKPVPDSLRTEVKIVYDDLGIYFGATMYDSNPEEIRRELTERDEIGADDFFFILLNGYNDRQQSMQFAVTAAGVQYDAKMTNMNEESSWNAVWYSAVKITDFGWVAEVFIPYSELRFPKKDIQVWGLQMEREVNRIGTRYSWSPVDNSKGSFSIFDGEIYGIENIKTPTRLSFQPYVSTYINNYEGETSVNFNGGMDLKYGINDAFTLDMVLIPDFGQTKFDETVLNLSAFEVQYNEQRPFFTEGTELFNIGNLFYSRRIGSAPTGRPELRDGEVIERFPASVDLLNALKVSGRTNSGLGIGFFNAVTERTFVDIHNSETGEVRNAEVEPLTNYNILVLDQRFGDNSSVSFVNTNTMREGNFRDANVTGLYTKLTNKNNTWNYRASAEGSWVFDDENKFGVEAQTGIAKISGKHRLELGLDLRTQDYDINDMGYSAQTNYINYSTYYGYRLLQPKGFLNNMFLNFNLRLFNRLEPDLYGKLVFNFNSSFTTKDFLNFGGGFETTPFGANDFYEPRIAERHVKIPDYYNVWLWFETNYRKKFSIGTVADWYKFNEAGRGTLNLSISPRYRVSDKFKINYSADFNFLDKEQGFVNYNSTNEEIIFGQRHRNTVINSLSGNYIFNNKMALNLAFRHYFSEVNYSTFYTLQPNGDLLGNPGHTNNYDTTYNSWNLDLRYSWWFAPGSQMTLLYRHAIDSYITESGQDFSQNFDYLFGQPHVNSLSLRVSYYLDYNRMKSWFQPRTIAEERYLDPKMGRMN
ncbi:MAG TPA: DUF5916 domain-containing protein [Gillisia sp.]|nr:DUF5916 domain-containing protein [Gillisia sp.]